MRAAQARITGRSATGHRRPTIVQCGHYGDPAGRGETARFSCAREVVP